MWGTFWKKSPTPPKNSPKKGIGTHRRKCEQRASFFCAFKGSFRVPLLQYRLRFLPLSLIDFFEASPYGVLANSGGITLASLREGGGPRRGSPKRACRVLGVLALAVEGACATLEFVLTLFCTRSPSVSHSLDSSLPEGA